MSTPGSFHQRRDRPRPTVLPRWPRIHGDKRQYWVDGVAVRMGWFQAGLLVTVLLISLAALDPTGTSRITLWPWGAAVVLGSLCYFFIGVPWVVRFFDLRRRRRSQTPEQL